MNIRRTKTRQQSYLKKYKGSKGALYQPVIARTQQPDAITTVTYNTTQKDQVMGGRKAGISVSTAKPSKRLFAAK